MKDSTLGLSAQVRVCCAREADFDGEKWLITRRAITDRIRPVFIANGLTKSETSVRLSSVLNRLFKQGELVKTGAPGVYEVTDRLRDREQDQDPDWGVLGAQGDRKKTAQSE